jgi:hypothetical protein
MWLIAACVVLGVAFIGTLSFVLVRASAPPDIPVVRNVQGHVVGGSIEFSWQDPGLASGDEYQVSVDGSSSSLQRSTSFTVDSADRRVCVTVTVNRSGRTGEASAAKCVDPVGSS